MLVKYVSFLASSLADMFSFQQIIKSHVKDQTKAKVEGSRGVEGRRWCWTQQDFQRLLQRARSHRRPTGILEGVEILLVRRTPTNWQLTTECSQEMKHVYKTCTQTATAASFLTTAIANQLSDWKFLPCHTTVCSTTGRTWTGTWGDMQEAGGQQGRHKDWVVYASIYLSLCLSACHWSMHLVFLRPSLSSQPWLSWNSEIHLPLSPKCWA